MYIHIYIYTTVRAYVQAVLRTSLMTPVEKVKALLSFMATCPRARVASTMFVIIILATWSPYSYASALCVFLTVSCNPYP